jgi:hypothetical protein
MPQAQEIKLGLCNKLLRRTGRVPRNSMVVCIAPTSVLFCTILWAGGIRVTTALGAPESVQPRPWGGGEGGAGIRSAEGWGVFMLRGGAVRECSCLHSRTHVYALCICVLLNACYVCVFSNP